MKQEQRWFHLVRARISLERSREARDPAIAAMHAELHDRHVALANGAIMSPWRSSPAREP